MPGMDMRAALTVVGDGPVGPIGRQLDEHFGMPEGHHKRDWAIGMKMVVNLPENCPLEAGHGVAHVRAIPSRRFSDSSTFIPTAWRRWGFSCRRGSTPPCARRTAISSTGCCTRICGVTSRRHAAFVGRKDASGIGPARRAAPCGRRLRAHRRRVGQHQRSHRAAAWTKRGRRARNWPRP